MFRSCVGSRVGPIMVFVLGTTFQKCLSFRENVENSEVLLLRQMTKFSRIVFLLLNPNGGGGLELMGGRGGSWERWEEGGGGDVRAPCLSEPSWWDQFVTDIPRFRVREEGGGTGREVLLLLHPLINFLLSKKLISRNPEKRKIFFCKK